MATVNKDFKIKSGLVVEGTTATVNGYDILTKKQDDQNYVVNLIGGTATSANEADKVVKRDGSGNFAAGVITADLVGDVTGNADTATALETSRTIELTGDVTGQVNFNGTQNVQISTTLNGSFATDAEVATAKSEAISAASSDATTKANNALADANDYTDAEIVTALSTAQGYANTAETNANSYTNTAITNLNLAGTYDALGAAAQALSDANDYTDTRETAITTAYQAYADQAETDAVAAAESYTNTAVANLVDSAPALLDTLNELAAAIGDNPDFIGTVTSAIGEKVAKAGDTMSGNLSMGTNKITSVGAPTANGDAANKLYVDDAASTAQSNANSYTDTEISALDTAAQGYASTAQSNAESFATNADSALYTTVTGDIATAKSQAEATAQGYANTAETNAESYASGLDSATNTRIDNLDTDDVAEGSNLYFTDGRAKDSAAALLTTANLTNITITGTGNGGLTITAENGVADSNTDQLTEGINNLYFTEQRALDAVSGSNIQPESVDITWVRREEATWTNVPTASTATVHSFATNKGSVKYLVRVISGSFSHVTEILATTDASNNVAVVEYGTIYTSENPLATATVVWDGQSAYNLNVTTANNNSEVLVAATLLAYND